MIKKSITVLALISLMVLSSCGTDNAGLSNDLFLEAIDNFSGANSIHLDVHSETLLESDLKSSGILDVEIQLTKEPYSRYSNQVNVYTEDDKEMYNIAYASYIAMVDNKLKLYEKSRNVAPETLDWKLSDADSGSIEKLVNYYDNERNAYLFLISSNANNFKSTSEEIVSGKTTLKYEGYFEKETAKACIDTYLKSSFE